MVWLNTQCSNEPAAPGSFGGSMCTCPKCKKKREDSARESREKVLEDHMKNLFKDSRIAMKDAFYDDPELFKGYQANVAMYLFDNCNVEHRIDFNHASDRNRIAKGLLELIFGMNENETDTKT